MSDRGSMAGLQAGKVADETLPPLGMTAYNVLLPMQEAQASFLRGAIQEKRGHPSRV